MERDWCAEYHHTANVLEMAKDSIEELEEENTALRAENEDFRKRLNPSFDYVDGQAVSVAEDEIDRLRAEVERLREWKESMLEVEKSWDVQRVGRELDMLPGSDIRAHILPAIIKLKADLAAAVELLRECDWYIRNTGDLDERERVLGNQLIKSIAAFLARMEVKK